jgi:hypothetical protein
MIVVQASSLRPRRPAGNLHHHYLSTDRSAARAAQ